MATGPTVTHTAPGTLLVGISSARLLAAAMQAQQEAAVRVQTILDTLVAEYDHLHGAALVSVDTDDGVLTFRLSEVVPEGRGAC